MAISDRPIKDITANIILPVRWSHSVCLHSFLPNPSSTGIAHVAQIVSGFSTATNFTPKDARVGVKYLLCVKSNRTVYAFTWVITVYDPKNGLQVGSVAIQCFQQTWLYVLQEKKKNLNFLLSLMFTFLLIHNHHTINPENKTPERAWRCFMIPPP